MKQNKEEYKGLYLFIACYNTESKKTQALILSKFKHEKAKRLLFKILEEKLENFWD